MAALMNIGLLLLFVFAPVAAMRVAIVRFRRWANEPVEFEVL